MSTSIVLWYDDIIWKMNLIKFKLLWWYINSLDLTVYVIPIDCMQAIYLLNDAEKYRFVYSSMHCVKSSHHQVTKLLYCMPAFTFIHWTQLIGTSDEIIS